MANDKIIELLEKAQKLLLTYQPHRPHCNCDTCEGIDLIDQAIAELKEKPKAFHFVGWTVMKAECVPLGQVWINPKEPALQPQPCKTCGDLKVVCKDGIGLVFGGIAEACPDCQKGE